MAIDLGTRRTGIALSDPSATLASPLETVSLTGDALLTHLRTLAEQHRVAKVVIGLPEGPVGAANEIAVRAQRLAAELRRVCAAEVVLWNEALSSWEAESILRGEAAGAAELRERRVRRGRRAGRARQAPGGRGGAREARRRRVTGEIDKLAATLILQDYLDAMRTGPSGDRPPGT
ncbi:MAG: Holliday junction resolvase RuvX [Candidatus Eisenbacteria sp.]|nr:Holliday junction resolvase RuvX [Candidatus Eisenbacteria bacterium]